MRLRIPAPKKDLNWLDEGIKKAKQKGKEYNPYNDLEFFYKKKVKHTPSPQKDEMAYIQKSIWRK